jgi:hypothetical protein
MKKSQAEATTAKNLEDKFERGEEVLDYFDAQKARVIRPQSKGTATKPTSTYSVKRNSKRPAAVREKSANYRNKK